VKALGYLRVSTEEQALEGVSFDAQERAVRAEMVRREWEAIDVVREVGSAKDMARPHLQGLLARLRASEAQVLVVARLDRLSRSTADFCALLDQANREGWQVLCLDPPVDMTSPFGKALAQMSAVFAELERALISQRTKDAIAAAKAAGTYKATESPVPMLVQERIARLRRAGWTWERIGRSLEEDGIMAPQGGPWPRRTLSRTFARVEARRAA
jgi:DNA invertase Pin-like site-specific DNA recombinase